ncbi:WecB/TagA/CpsF family glycosyltransferase [Paenibacillus bovis]|uniref:N-acetylglucosaminyldiphosphoundecaprenol N-acetyl-beta-D-mannosaminyltransferase n=1 Tax=Paenibacillus bovis TaxID=1616788 RepID=A0A172ZLJ6_9BACL|nr:WecB/TagA/CpsF family glycosyltransferase [Paenibacillus bovis]ANF98506.1 N-acetylmannosaminyltransferase [Paenibacillus bovis]
MNQFQTIPTVPIYGLNVSKLNMNDTVSYLESIVGTGKPHQIITANPIMIMTALEQPQYMHIMKNAELLVPDGAGLVWAASTCGQPVAERVTGFDLLHRLLDVGQKHSWKVYLLGSTPEVIQAAAARLQSLYPGIVIAGYRDGFFGPDQDAEVIAGIREAAPDLLFVARGADTQEPWIGRYKQELGVPIMMGVGGSFDIISGKTKRAPVAFQKLRMEWFYRLMKEPYRYKRMLVLPKFALKVLKDKESVVKAQ